MLQPENTTVCLLNWIHKINSSDIAVVDGKMPSEIAQKTYILNENLQPTPIEKEDYIKKADLLNHDTGIDLKGL